MTIKGSEVLERFKRISKKCFKKIDKQTYLNKIVDETNKKFVLVFDLNVFLEEYLITYKARYEKYLMSNNVDFDYFNKKQIQ